MAAVSTMLQGNKNEQRSHAMPEHVPADRSADPAPLADSRERLTRTSVVLHWAVAVAMIAMLGFGLYLAQMERGDAKSALVQVHKSFGSLVLFLVAVRIWWRLRQGALVPLGDHPRWQQVAATASHHFLLFASIAMPLTGFIRSIGRGRSVDIFGYPFIPQLLAEKNEALSAFGSLAHEVVAYSMLAVIVAHVLAAMKHHLIDGDGTLQRILGARVG
jgi:cytochrome b561